MTHMVREHRISRAVRTGFTLIELMIGIVIIGIIVGGGIYTAMRVMQAAKSNATKTTMQTIKTSLMLYKQEKGEYPKSLQELRSERFLGKELPKDGWDQNFVYRLTSEGPHPYELFSYGPGGKGGNKADRIDAWSK